jgi:hypothetical protein
MINVTVPLTVKIGAESRLDDMWAEFFSALSIAVVSCSTQSAFVSRRLAARASMGLESIDDSSVDCRQLSPAALPLSSSLIARPQLWHRHFPNGLPSVFRTASCGQTYFWLPNLQVWIAVNSQDSTSGLTMPVAVADETGFPVACIIGEPQPGKYCVFLQPPPLNRQLYPKLTAAVFAEGRRSKRTLWLIEGPRQIKLCQIVRMTQLTGARPDKESDWLAAAFESVREMDLNGAFDDYMQTTWP